MRQSRTYYNAGARPVAVRTIANVPGVPVHEVQYLHPDHLGSIGQITSQTGAWVQDVYYYPYGGIRWSQSGGNTISPTSSTRRTYTGQYDIGFWAGSLMHYNARQYSPVLGRFLQPDTIVPGAGNPQALNRYSYGLSNPLKYTDPTGHYTEDQIQHYLGVGSWQEVLDLFGAGGQLEGRWGWLETLRRAADGDQLSYDFGREACPGFCGGVLQNGQLHVSLGGLSR